MISAKYIRLYKWSDIPVQMVMDRPLYFRQQIVLYSNERLLKGVEWYAGALFKMNEGSDRDFELIEAIKDAIKTGSDLPNIDKNFIFNKNK